MLTVASTVRDTAITAIFTAQGLTSPVGALVGLAADIDTAKAAGQFEVTGVTLTPTEMLAVKAMGYTVAMTGDTCTVGWVRTTR